VGGPGSGGWNRKSDRLKRLQGTSRRDRGGGGVWVPPGRPACPRWLPKEAKREWRRVCQGLEGRITKLDRAILALYCAAWSRFLEACQALRELEPGAPEWRLWQRVKAGEARELEKCAKLLGLTPASRQRLPEAGPPPSSLKRFLEGQIDE